MLMKQMRQAMVVLVFLGAAMLAGEVRGSLIEFTFGGYLSSVNGTPPPPWDGISVGSEFSISYVFDTEEPDMQTSSAVGIYDIVAAWVTLDGISQATTTGQIKVDILNPLVQRYSMNFSGLPIGAGGNLQLVGSFVLDSDVLPTTLNLDDWLISQGFELGIISGEYGMSGSISTFSSRIVPAPGILMSFGLMGLAARRTRK